jgi:hypothetical protein
MTHGMVKLAGGVKMSSRKGNILRAVDVLDVAAAANKTASGKDDPQVVLGAVKYAFLKQRLGGDIIYDPEESVSLQGNSGPYLQYAHARARSILAKAPVAQPDLTANLEAAERSLLRKISEYPEVVDTAVRELMPHHICTYLYELAQAFNSFYEHNRVMGHERQGQRLALVTVYADTLKLGKRLPARSTRKIISTIIFMCSIAIYLGRDLRWNTWDLFVNPAGILFDVSDRLINSQANSQMFITIFSFYLLLGTIYIIIRNIAHQITSANDK